MLSPDRKKQAVQPFARPGQLVKMGLLGKIPQLPDAIVQVMRVITGFARVIVRLLNVIMRLRDVITRLRDVITGVRSVSAGLWRAITQPRPVITGLQDVIVRLRSVKMALRPARMRWPFVGKHWQAFRCAGGGRARLDARIWSSGSDLALGEAWRACDFLRLN